MCNHKYSEWTQAENSCTWHRECSLCHNEESKRVGCEGAGIFAVWSLDEEPPIISHDGIGITVNGIRRT